MKKTIISLSLVTCMTLGLGVHNLGMITDMKDNHKNDISMNLSLKNDDASPVARVCAPGDFDIK